MKCNNKFVFSSTKHLLIIKTFWFWIRKAEAQSVTRWGLHLSQKNCEYTNHHFSWTRKIIPSNMALKLPVPLYQLSEWRCHSLILNICYFHLLSSHNTQRKQHTISPCVCISIEQLGKQSFVLYLKRCIVGVTSITGSIKWSSSETWRRGGQLHHHIYVSMWLPFFKIHLL